jgi:MFS family permease
VITGAILQHASWRWLFLVNLPVGALAIVLAIFFPPNDREETKQGWTREVHASREGLADLDGVAPQQAVQTSRRIAAGSAGRKVGTGHAVA